MLTRDREEVLERILEYEKTGEFNTDVENDPPTVPLKPEDVDYLYEKPFAKTFMRIANRLAINYYEKQIKNGDIVIKDIVGLDNFRAVKSGAILTCNHFSRSDNYVIYRAIKNDLNKRQFLYKVIKEGNYNAYDGLLGFFFKHCNTLPLSSNLMTMKKFLKSVSILLARGEKILIYPEQSMWWNYRKPRPLKVGAFNIASQNFAPVVPCLITMQDGTKILTDGSKVQEYTVHFLPAIYPDKNKSVKENANYMMEENYKAWKNLYEAVYGKKLIYGE